MHVDVTMKMHAFVAKKSCDWVVTHTVTQHKKSSNYHANLPLEMYSFTL